MDLNDGPFSEAEVHDAASDGDDLVESLAFQFAASFCITCDAGLSRRGGFTKLGRFPRVLHGLIHRIRQTVPQTPVAFLAVMANQDGLRPEGVIVVGLQLRGFLIREPLQPVGAGAHAFGPPVELRLADGPEPFARGRLQEDRIDGDFGDGESLGLRELPGRIGYGHQPAGFFGIPLAAEGFDFAAGRVGVAGNKESGDHREEERSIAVKARIGLRGAAAVQEESEGAFLDRFRRRTCQDGVPFTGVLPTSFWSTAIRLRYTRPVKNKLDEILEILELMPKWEDWEAQKQAILLVAERLDELSEQIHELAEKIVRLEETMTEKKRQGTLF